MASDKMEMDASEDEDIIMNNGNNKNNNTDNDEQIARRLQEEQYHHLSEDIHDMNIHDIDITDNHNHKNQSRAECMMDEDEDDDFDANKNDSNTNKNNNNKQTGKIILRDYQKQAVKSLKCDKSRMQCIMPCGTGKTIVMLDYLLRKCMQSKVTLKIVILVPSLQLINQIYQAFVEYFGTQYKTLCICSQMDKITLTQ
eukprot:274706_1